MLKAAVFVHIEMTTSYLMEELSRFAGEENPDYNCIVHINEIAAQLKELKHLEGLLKEGCVSTAFTKDIFKDILVQIWEQES